MQDAPTITFVIRADSRDVLLVAERVATRKADLDSVITNVIRRYPRGVEKTEEVKYRLGDYFDGIQIVDDKSDDNRSFSLVFHPRADAGRFWRDLMAAVVTTVSASVDGISVSSIERSG